MDRWLSHCPTHGSYLKKLSGIKHKETCKEEALVISLANGNWPSLIFVDTFCGAAPVIWRNCPIEKSDDRCIWQVQGDDQASLTVS